MTSGRGIAQAALDPESAANKKRSEADGVETIHLEWLGDLLVDTVLVRTGWCAVTVDLT